jgi:hypothetical protein
MNLGISKQAERVFDKTHCDKVWLLLEEKFSFNIKFWKDQCRYYIDHQPRNVHELEAFLQFGNDNINPVLNKVLGRNEHHNTWYKLVEYVIRQSIPAKLL